MTTNGMAFHVHHSRLVEYCFDYDERVEYIKTNKPANEQALRLRLFKMIPKDRGPQTGLKRFMKAREAFDRAREAYIKAHSAFDKAYAAFGTAREACIKAREACNKAGEAFDRAREAYIKAYAAYIKAHAAYIKAHSAFDTAWEAYIKAREAYNTKNKSAIEALHKELCPDCPWDGDTIFTREDEKGDWI